MTDVKPFVIHDSSPPSDRSVAVLLVASGTPMEPTLRVPGLLDPLGPTCLFDLALQCLDGVQEATERGVWADDTALLERFEAEQHPGVRLLAAPPEQSLRRGVPDALLASHVVVLDGRYPFLRPNTIDEAIRLLRLRADIEAIKSCVRVQGGVYDLAGESVRDKESPVLLSCPAFSFVPAEVLGLGRALKAPPFPFEIGASEGFRVDTPFTAELAGALLSQRRATDIRT